MPAILIVRPENRLSADLALCAEYGWQGVPFAPLAVVPLPAALRRLPDALGRAEAAVWVSPTAVELAGSLKTFSIPHIAVGRATADALRRAGAAHAICPETGNDSEAVRRLEIWNRLKTGARVLIVRGEGGRNWLSERLYESGFAIRHIEIYRTAEQDLDWTLFQAACACAAWVPSSAAAVGLFRQTPPALMQTVQSLLYFTHHPRIGGTLRALGAQHIRQVSDLRSALQSADAADLFPYGVSP